MDFEFAFSRGMQIILIIVTLAAGWTEVYWLSKLILMLYSVKSTTKQKVLFSLWATLFYNAFIYIIYFINGAQTLSTMEYRLAVFPSPVHAILLYFCSIILFKLPPVRSLRPLSHSFIYFALLTQFNFFLEQVLFTQTTEQFNYFRNLCQVLVAWGVHLAAYSISTYLIRHRPFTPMLADKRFVDAHKEWFLFGAKVVIVCAVPYIVAFLVPERAIADFFSTAIVALLYTLNLSVDAGLSLSALVASRDMHIQALSGSLSEFNQVKHDFYNILQTYGGYLEMGDLEGLRRYHKSLSRLTINSGNAIDLSRRLAENPPLVSLLISKSEYAENLHVNIRFAIGAPLEPMYIDSLDLCRALSFLLDNAIEAAAESEARSVFFGVEKRNSDSVMLILTNSTAAPINMALLLSSGDSVKLGQQGLGISTVRNALEKYPNCRFHYAYHQYELSVYIEIRAL